MAKAKEAYYFSHDSNAQDDPKCMLLIDQLGMEGYGIFWALIERLRNETEYKLPLLILPALAKRWCTSKEKVESVIKNYSLFICENEFFFSPRLKDSMNLKSEKARISANYRWGDANALQTHSERNANGMRNDAIKGKEKKIKEKKQGDSFFKKEENPSNDGKPLRGRRIDIENEVAFFPDGSYQKLGADQLFMAKKGQLHPQDVFKGSIY
jgi:hypothetical protein